MSSDRQSERLTELNGTTVDALEFELKNAFGNFIYSIGRDNDATSMRQKKIFLIKTIMDMEAEKIHHVSSPKKIFTVNASEFANNNFKKLDGPYGFIGSYFTGGRRRTNKHKKHNNKSRRH
jgi:hypothetical protein